MEKKKVKYLEASIQNYNLVEKYETISHIHNGSSNTEIGQKIFL